MFAFAFAFNAGSYRPSLSALANPRLGTRPPFCTLRHWPRHHPSGTSYKKGMRNG